MSDRTELAKTELMDAAEIQHSDVEQLLGNLMSRQVDLGELFFQNTRAESWSLEDGRVKDGAFSVDRGVGVRAVSGEKTGFAYADDIALPALTQATDAASKLRSRRKAERLSQLRPSLMPSWSVSCSSLV